MFNIVHVRKTLWIAVTRSRKNGRVLFNSSKIVPLDIIRENEALEIWTRKIRKTINFIKNEQKGDQLWVPYYNLHDQILSFDNFSGLKVHLRRDSVK